VKRYGSRARRRSSSAHERRLLSPKLPRILQLGAHLSLSFDVVVPSVNNARTIALSGKGPLQVSVVVGAGPSQAPKRFLSSPRPATGGTSPGQAPQTTSSRPCFMTETNKQGCAGNPALVQHLQATVCRGTQTNPHFSIRQTPQRQSSELVPDLGVGRTRCPAHFMYRMAQSCICVKTAVGRTMDLWILSVPCTYARHPHRTSSPGRGGPARGPSPCGLGGLHCGRCGRKGTASVPAPDRSR